MKKKNRLTIIIQSPSFSKTVTADTNIWYIVQGHEGQHIVKEHSDSKSKYSEDDTIKMFGIDNIFVVFAGKVFFFNR